MSKNKSEDIEKIKLVVNGIRDLAKQHDLDDAEILMGIGVTLGIFMRVVESSEGSYAGSGATAADVIDVVVTHAERGYQAVKLSAASK